MDSFLKLSRREFLHTSAALGGSALFDVPSAFSVGVSQPALLETHTDSLGMEFVLIPAGSFLMGTDDSEIIELKDLGHRWDWERKWEKWEQDLKWARKMECRWESAVTSHILGDQKPWHCVTISRPFYLGKSPVTQRQWEAVMGDNPSYFQGRPDNPVERVSWRDAQEFIARLNRREGSGKYRLPTEAEWEYACRADTTSYYSFNPTNYGDDGISIEEWVDRMDLDYFVKVWLGTYDCSPWEREFCHLPVWYSNNSKNQTSITGKKPPNPWGLHDMLGNVWEWVQDWYGENYYAGSPVVDPKGPSEGWSRVLRGGSWYSDEGIVLLNTYRLNSPPNTRDSSIGFRLALSIEHP
jgi:formylglycine-generating enzyme required for sulfatase activity